MRIPYRRDDEDTHRDAAEAAYQRSKANINGLRDPYPPAAAAQVDGNRTDAELERDAYARSVEMINGSRK